MRGVTRRGVMAGALALSAGRGAWAQDGGEAGGAAWSHGLSVFGELKYGPGFRHFDYVDPAAPKGGAVALQITGITGNQNFETFDSLNAFVLKGSGAAGMGLTFDSLMAAALDEPDAQYGLAAEAVRWSEDRLTYRFRMRRQARFHDGSPLTARDAAFSLTILKEKGHPTISQLLGLVVSAQAEGDELVVRFDPRRGRTLPLVVANLPIFSADYYGTRPFEESTLDVPLGSGPYRVGRFEVGRFISFERVPDYWAKDLPVNVGRHNFDEVRYEYFRDRQVALEAFKAGVTTYREEFTARLWANGYDFPALREGKVRRELLPDRSPAGAQGWFFNLRRGKFKDPRVREAIGTAFDFEWTNANIMFSAYRRTASFFENSDLKAEGPPSAAELALLEPWRGRVPDEVFGEPYAPPRSDGSGQDRALLRRADQLLREAGCRREGNQLKLPGGEPLEIEFIEAEGSLQPHTQAFIRNLGLLGIRATSRIIDPAQYQRRTDAFDFDVTSRRLPGLPTPSEGLKVAFTSEAAANKGSINISGISDPAVDAMVGAALAADSRDELRTACRALDRVLRALRPWVPMWHSAEHRVAHWDLFGHPPEPPTYDLGVPSTWWFDAAKARRIGRA